MLRRNPEDIEAIAMIGFLYIKTDDIEKGIGQLKIAEKFKKPDSDFFFKFAMTIKDVPGQEGQAERLLKRAIKTNPDHIEALSQLGMLYEKQDRIEEAIKYFKLATKIPKQSPFAHYSLGLNFLKLKDQENAEFHFRQCILADKSHFGACFNLGLICFAKKDFLKSEKLFKNCIKLFPNSI